MNMTENEMINGWTFEETVKTAENLMEAENNIFKWDVLRHLRDFAENFKEELEQYRAIGTVEDVTFYKKCYDEELYEFCGEYGTDNCGCKGRMEYLEKKVAEFEAVGTIEEFANFIHKKAKENNGLRLSGEKRSWTHASIFDFVNEFRGEKLKGGGV